MPETKGNDNSVSLILNNKKRERDRNKIYKLKITECNYRKIVMLGLGFTSRCNVKHQASSISTQYLESKD